MMCRMKGDRKERMWGRRPGLPGLAIVALLLAGSVRVGLAGPLGHTTFASPEAASGALVAAVEGHDEQALTRILGAGRELISSDDDVQDSLDRERFVQKYREMHRLVRQPRGVNILAIGAENWPFPIPLVSRNGVWQFDSDSGAHEIRCRRIGENEVTAIGLSQALVTAEARPGTDSEADALVKTAFPHALQAREPLPFHGYYFRVRSKPGGGFFAIAYPAVYRTSGVMTFVVNQDEVVYEKDLGPDSAKRAGTMNAYHPDSSWTPAESTP